MTDTPAASAERLPLLLRQATQDDVPFITSSWLKSYRNDHVGFAVACPNRIYFAMHHRILEDILPRALVVVAAAEDDPRTILGWACYERPADGASLILHYLYVKRSFRSHGVARQLLSTILAIEGEPATVFCTHWTKASDHCRALSRARFVYNPYQLFAGLKADWHDPAALTVERGPSASEAPDEPAERPGENENPGRGSATFARDFPDGSRWRGGTFVG